MAKATTTKVAELRLIQALKSRRTKQILECLYELTSCGAAVSAASLPASSVGEAPAASKLPSRMAITFLLDGPEGPDSCVTMPPAAHTRTSQPSVPLEGSQVPMTRCRTTAGRTTRIGSPMTYSASRAGHEPTQLIPASANYPRANLQRTDHSVQHFSTPDPRVAEGVLQPVLSVQTPTIPIVGAQSAANSEDAQSATIAYRCIGVTLPDAAHQGLMHKAPNIRVAVDVRRELHFGGCGQVFTSAQLLFEHLREPSVSCIGYLTKVDGTEDRRVLLRGARLTAWRSSRT